MRTCCSRRLWSLHTPLRSRSRSRTRRCRRRSRSRSRRRERLLAAGAAAALQHSLKWIAGDLPQLLLTIGPVPTTAKPAFCFLEPRCVRLRLRPAAAAADGHCDSDDGDSEDSAGAADSDLCVQLPCVVDVEGVNVVMWSRRSQRLRLRLRPL